MSFIVVGTNHKYSPIELREKLSFSKKRLKDALIFLREERVLKGAVILSTCNRVEVYASAEDPDAGIKKIEDFISRYHEINKGKFSPYTYIYEGKEALRHLFSVASGLDSLILGETQILSQVKFSFFEAEKVGFADGVLREAFYSAISFAKRIHRSTQISEGKVSIGSVAIDFIKKRIGTLSGKNILIVGVGKVTELVLKYLKEEAPNVVFISNRTFEKARNLAEQIGARAVRFDDLKEFLKDADVVITATGSPHFVIKKETVEACNHKLLVVDLAVPRDVDPEIKEIKGIELFDLEEVSSIIQKNIEKRKIEAKKVRENIDVEVERLWDRLTELEQEPALLP